MVLAVGLLTLGAEVRVLMFYEIMKFQIVLQ
jgi:hypothetical protein